jgi:methionyl-tRNA formyltransferase
MRVAFLGNAPWSVPTLRALAGSAHHVSLVLTRAPKPAGRGNVLTPTAVAGAARGLGLALAEVLTVKSGDGFESLAASDPQALVVVAYGEILPQTVLDVPAIAPVNLHFSLLPELRGAAPVQRAIMEGLAVTGVTTIRMDAGMDTGPVLLREAEAIDPDDDAATLGARLAALGGRLVVDTLDRLAAGAIVEEPQDNALATMAPKVGREERVIDWRLPADRIVRLVRALSPEPAATTTFRGRGIKVIRARVASGQPGTAPATVAIASKSGLGITSGDGLVSLEEIAPEGRRRMSGAEFVHGYRPQAGEALA